MWILLLLPFIGLLWVPFYNFTEPALFGFPFFYWYQLACGADQLAADLAGLSPGVRLTKRLERASSWPIRSNGLRFRFFIFFFVLVTVMGFFAARWKSGPVSEHLDEWGLGGRQVRHLDHLVPGRRRFLHRLHGDRGAGAGLCGRRLRLLRAALHHHRLSLRLCRDAACCGRWRMPTAMSPRPTWSYGTYGSRGARTRGRDHRHGRHHALHRAATHRHGRGDQGDGADRRIADRRRLRHPGPLHLRLRAARAGADRLRQGHHDLHRGAGGGRVVPSKLGGYGAVFAAAEQAFAAKGGATGLVLEAGADAALRHIGAWFGPGGFHVSAYADRQSLQLEVAPTPSARTRSCCPPTHCCSA